MKLEKEKEISIKGRHALWKKGDYEHTRDLAGDRRNGIGRRNLVFQKKPRKRLVLRMSVHQVTEFPAKWNSMKFSGYSWLKSCIWVKKSFIQVWNEMVDMGEHCANRSELPGPWHPSFHTCRKETVCKKDTKMSMLSRTFSRPSLDLSWHLICIIRFWVLFISPAFIVVVVVVLN